MSSGSTRQSSVVSLRPSRRLWVGGKEEPGGAPSKKGGKAGGGGGKEGGGGGIGNGGGPPTFPAPAVGRGRSRTTGGHLICGLPPQLPPRRLRNGWQGESGPWLRGPRTMPGGARRGRRDPRGVGLPVSWYRGVG